MIIDVTTYIYMQAGHLKISYIDSIIFILMSKFQFVFPVFMLLTSYSSFAQKSSINPSEQAEKIRTRMENAFGGKATLSKLEYITYKISRQSYVNTDTIRTTQLWYMHLRKPLIIKLDLAGQHTVKSVCTASMAGENVSTCNNLLRARFYNFLYILTSPGVEFSWLKKTTYRGKIVDIIRVSEKSAPERSLDIFVEENGEIITTSALSESSGQYERFADEFHYVQLEDGIRFPLEYSVVVQGITKSAGVFTEFSINQLTPAWKRWMKQECFSVN